MKIYFPRYSEHLKHVLESHSFYRLREKDKMLLAFGEYSGFFSLVIRRTIHNGVREVQK